MTGRPTVTPAGPVDAPLPRHLIAPVGQHVSLQRAGRRHSIRVVGVKEAPAPWYNLARQGPQDHSARREILEDATVDLEVDGAPLTVRCGPYQPPAVTGDVALSVDMTAGFTGGLVPYPPILSNAVALSVQDSSVPWMPPGLFRFPIEDFSWQSTNYRNSWLEKVHLMNDPPYYHRGDDFGSVPDRAVVVSPCDGVIRQAPGAQGDGASNSVVIESRSGYVVRLAHMNTPHVRHDLRAGTAVSQGEPLRRTGSTWQGRAGVWDPHLHVEIHHAGVPINTFPVLLQAYQEAYPSEVVPLTGARYMAPVGTPVTLRGAAAVPGRGRRMVPARWALSDGRTVEGDEVEISYGRPGVYSERVTFRDSGGGEAVGFAEVAVYDPARPIPVPRALISYFPSRRLRAGDAVTFQLGVSQMADATIEYGDGMCAPCRASKSTETHTYAAAGDYTVTVSATEPLPATYRVLVRVLGS